MPDTAFLSLETGVAVLMLILAFRSLTWHRISRPLNSLVLLLVLVAAWKLLTDNNPFSFEHALLYCLCVLLGLVVGFARGQVAPMRYDRREDDAICRRGAVLIFCWAAAALGLVILRTAPHLFTASWELGLTAALTFFTATFWGSTLTLFVRMNGVREEGAWQTEESQSLPV